MRLHDYAPPLVAEAGPDVSTLAMVAVYPSASEAEALALEGGLDDLHCTLVFLGEADDLDDEAVTAAVAQAALELAPLAGTVGGVGRFTENPDGIPVIALPDVQGLTLLRERVVDELGHAGVRSPSEHGFLPHMTLTYAAADGVDLEAAEEKLGLPLTFDAVTVVIAGERYDYELTGARVAAAMYTVPTPDELTAATQRVIDRLQADEHVAPLAASYEQVLEQAGRRMARSFTSKAVALTADSRFVPPGEDEVVNGDRLADEIGELASEAQREAGRVVVAALDDEGISYDVDTVFTEELLERVALNAAFNLEGELRGTYRAVLEQAAAEGWSVVEAADVIADKIASLAPHTARAIARTELNGLANGGSVHVASKTVGKDQQLYKTWLATDDERTRESHVEANGQSVLVNDRFTVDGFPLNYPGDPFGPPEIVINCRCTVTYSSEPGGTVVTDPDQAAAAPDPLAHIKPKREGTLRAEEVWSGPSMRDLAGEHGLTMDEYRRKLEERLANDLKDVRVKVRTPADVAVEIANDGRFMNQFETQTSEGAYAPEMRRSSEEQMFGIDYLAEPGERPIYGYLDATVEKTGATGGYGEVAFVMKPGVNARTTWTSSDSLNSFVVPSPLARPSVLSVDPYRVADPLKVKNLGELTTHYLEAQVHGGLAVDDIDLIEVWYEQYRYEGASTTDAGFLARARSVEAELRAAYPGVRIELREYPPDDYIKLRRASRASGEIGEQALGLGQDTLGIDVVGGVAPVPAGGGAGGRQLVADDQGGPIEHAHHGRGEPVATAAREEHEVAAAALSDHLHTSNDTASGGGSQPSEPLPSHDANEEVPMSTTATKQAAQAVGQLANGDGEVEMLSPVAWDAVLCAEGETTEDGRLLERGSISWRDLPLTLMGMLKTGGWGHEGAEVSGRIDSISRVADELPASGELTSDFGVNKLAPLIADRTVRGVSIDLAVLDWEYRDRDTGEKLSEEDLFDYWIEGREQDIVFTVLEGTIVGATVCPMPAIANAEITLAASAGLSTHARQLVAAAIDGRNIGPDDVRIITVFTPFDRKRGEGLISSAVRFETEAPPRSHFEVSEFPGPTPWTVLDDGRCFGHLATWETCHVGLPGVCVTAPRTSTDPAYALFHQGQWPVAEGGTIDVGKMMLGTGHADLGASRMEATRHYDKPNMVGAYVRAVDGEHGIWVSGVVRPELSAAGLRELRANPPSGDWRSYNGQLELIAACAVAVPGFPVVAGAQAPGATANITAAGGTLAISALIASSGVIVPTSAVRDALVAAGCDCEDMTADEYVDDLAELAG